ncbi:sensor histidine kinase, partial [Streptomyces sp. NPDC002537]
MRRLRLPGGERARLTLLYGGLLVLAGGMLIGLVNFLVRQGLDSSISTAVAYRVPELGQTVPVPTSSDLFVPASPEPALPPPSGSAVTRARTIETFTHVAEQAAQNRLLTVSLIALAVFAVISAALAWWMAGRVLRPVGVITR